METENKRVFDGVEKDYTIKACPRILYCFWCTREVPICIQDWALFVGKRISLQGFFFLIYYLSMDAFCP